ncbi:MAG: CoA transferase [Acidimicrobiales bacterium]|nr:CoA transferase [Acidimicrobiales bacterium]
MLSALRVLDLSDQRGQLCGQILAFLGAEVILVEPPGGSPARRLGPFVDGADPDDGEHSLFFWSYNRGKRSIVLDLDTEEGRAHLRRLAAGADVLVESFDPGRMAAWGLGPDDLAALNPALIVTSITPFGSTGPKAHWAASDLTIVAAGGQMSLTGDDDRAPLRVTVPQADAHAGAEAAGAVLVALYERQHLSGTGQHVDISAQHSVLQAAQSMMLARPVGASLLTRVAGGIKAGPIHVQLMWPCADGYVSVTLLFGAAIAPFTQNLVDWARAEGFVDDETAGQDWVTFTAKIFTTPEGPPIYEKLKADLARFFLTKTKQELLDNAFSRRLLIAPVTTTAEVMASPQLAARDFWQDVTHPDGRTVRYPGALAKLTGTPLPSLPAAPTLGRDTAEVLAEPARTPSVPAVAAAPQRTGKALEGLKVLDLMWVMAGPAASRVLADYGATVVRIESSKRVDTARTIQPFRNDGTGVDDSGLFNNMNAGKLALALDMSKPEARDVILDLVRWADVVLEAFSPKAMKGWGLDYETLRAVNPRIVMLSTCLMGQSGPWMSLAGFGTMASAISGFFNLAGWPDRAPCGPFGAYTDYTAPKLTLAVLMAAVEHQRRTGEGQYIDFSQGEASMQFLAPAILDQSVNGRQAERHGNDDVVFAPHGVYRCAGEDRWVAVAVTDDASWRALCGVLDRGDLASLDAQERRARRRELDELISTWTATLGQEAAEERLQAAGVAAHQVQNSPECIADPQLASRHAFLEVDHASLGTTWVEGSRFVLSRTPATVTRGGPVYGQDTFEILTDILGYDGDRIAELAVAELLE